MPFTQTTYGCQEASVLYQSFTPTRRLLLAVDLQMRAGGSFPASGTAASVTIRSFLPTGSIVAQATTFVPGSVQSGATVTLHFDFSPPAVLEPEGLFVIQPSLFPAFILTWFGRDDNPYPGGTSFSCIAAAIPTQDLNFATYTPDDTAAPETVVATGPREGSFSSSAQAAFQFSGRDDLSYASKLRFDCALDGATFSPCASQTQLTAGEGRHWLAVRAIDEAGHADPTPAERSWVVDRTPPTRPTILGPGATRPGVVTYRFFARDGLTPRTQITFRCAVGSAPLRPCSRRYRARLNVGAHALKVIAVDLAGNTSRMTKVQIRVSKSG